jgi:hypothetical protein
MHASLTTERNSEPLSKVWIVLLLRWKSLHKRPEHVTGGKTVGSIRVVQPNAKDAFIVFKRGDLVSMATQANAHRSDLRH